ncbi:MAG: DUF1080 domain-containing protein [Cyclobacteriaceae bacterium]|nr:DUF1080 domain-containing protein [Cyclobacteriaceae bacterium]
MKKYLIYSLALMALFACQPPRPAQQVETQWVSLFDGKSLEGWTIRIVGKELNENFGNTFRVDSGLLKIRYDQYESFDGQFGALYYNTPFTNYRLRVEYRFVGQTAPGAPEWGYRDSGVQYHGQSPQAMEAGQSFPVCLEYNLLGGNGTDERPNGQICVPGTTVETGAGRNTSFCTMPDVRRTFPGDQWVTLEIEVQDTVISHYANGELLLTYYNPRYDSTHAIARTLITNDNDRIAGGYISLQSNSQPIDFRKIEILEY